MSQIFSKTISCSFKEWVDRFSQSEYQGHKVEIWSFNDKLSRHDAQCILKERGVNATVYSAYKPLLHFCLENLSIEQCQFERVEIEYPMNATASEKRFLLEAYPLAALISAEDVYFIANDSLHDSYIVTLRFVDGTVQQYRVFAPNVLRKDAMGSDQLVPSSWLRVSDTQGNIVEDKPLLSAYEQTFLEVMEGIKQYDWQSDSPYFQRLELRVQIPVKDEPLTYEHEVISLKEALHEDLYFSIQEHFKALEGKDAISRDSQPGQIVPYITESEDGDYHINVGIKPYQINADQSEFMPLAKVTRPLSVEQVLAELNGLGGESLEVSTITGNTVNATYIEGSDKPVFVSGGQHANETTGVVGALRACKSLLNQQESHLVVSPLANPDGYALFHEFIKDNPYHMHHAARYTALGDDLEYRSVEPLYEKGMRKKAVAVSGAKLHINLHGYPSHEWTRPFSGYVPNGFDMWTIPKGFFLVIRHSNEGEWSDYAERFVHELTLKLQSCTEVLEMNKKQIALYEQHAGETGFRMINGFPCFVSGVDNAEFPLHLITEYPDETVYGEDFIKGHDVQMATVLAAYEVYQSMS